MKANKKTELKFDPNDFSRRNIGGDLEFKRTNEQNRNIDDEIQKIIADSLVKAKGTSKTVINPLQDIKKKELNKLMENTSKIKLITKQAHTKQVVIRELDKTIFTDNKNSD